MHLFWHFPQKAPLSGALVFFVLGGLAEMNTVVKCSRILAFIVLTQLQTGYGSARLQAATAKSSKAVSATTLPPSITSSAQASFTQGATFSYQIVASNDPTKYGATGLPSGLSLNTTTGLISGTALTSQQVSVQLSATNAYGEGAMTLVLTPSNTPNLVGTTNNCLQGTTPPTPAAANGLTQIVFCDDFDSLSTIDTKATGDPGYNWYPRSPWNILPTSVYSVANSALRLSTAVYTTNWGLASTDVKTGAGHNFTFGYFEARINFNPTLGPNGAGWPSFWSVSTDKAEFGALSPYGELDFFEAFPQTSPGNYYGFFGGTIHDWRGSSQTGYTDYINSPNSGPTGANWTQWHVVGCLWLQGQATWYLDGTALFTQRYSASTTGSPAAVNAAGGGSIPVGVFDVLDTEPLGNMLILGTGPAWPMDVDYVRVWQK
jgi:hypothetical protein